VKLRTASVEVYIDNTPVGSGELVYSDVSENALAPYTMFHCNETPVYIDSDIVTLSFCFEDTVTQIISWTSRKKLTVPVLLDSEQIGTATIEIVDEAGTSLLGLVAVALVVLIVGLMVKRGAKKK
jgi:hypothetical protein